MIHEKFASPAWEKGSGDRWATAVFLLSVLAWLTVAGILIFSTLPEGNGGIAGRDWFDPFFFQYNVLLGLFAILIVPAIVYFYVRMMKPEKHRRLREEMAPEEWSRVEEEVVPRIERQFRFRQYLGSVSAVTFVVAAGVVIMLLMKPYFPSEEARAMAGDLTRGVDFGRGANILMLGPFIETFPGDLAAFYHQVVIGLTAFQFGFLGAYVYFIGALLRSYFTLDLSTHTLVAGTIRMVTGSVLALVFSFVLPQILGGVEDDKFLRTLPVFAFFIGFFPKRGLLWIDVWGSKLLGLGARRYRQTQLGTLSGMSTQHETRLEREGYDNTENLAHANALDLAVRTGFGYRQLRSWIGEARLRLALRDDYEAFTAKTWLRTDDQVRSFYEGWSGTAAEATQHLAQACDGMAEKIRNLALLLGCETAEARES